MTQHIESYDEGKNRTFEGKENDPLTESWEVRQWVKTAKKEQPDFIGTPGLC